MSKKTFVYIPSFSGGFFGNLLVKNHYIGDIPCRFYNEDAPVEIKHNAFLTTAGHYYKKSNYIEAIGLDVDSKTNMVFGDSGGFQIATGAIKWDISIRDKIFNWLEHNSNIAINLDIPPRLKWAGREKEALDITIDNFKYFEKHQTGKTKFLNVLQGTNLQHQKNWYDKVKTFDFQGWAVGGSGGKYSLFFSSVYLLIKNKEHFNKNNILLHFLGTSTINEFLFYIQLQKSLNEVGSNMTVTSDSSTPQRAVIWGTYYTEFDISNGRFKNINFPNIKHQPDIINNLSNNRWPILCEFDKKLSSAYDWTEYLKETTGLGNQQYMGAMTLHNFAVFKEAINKLDGIIEQDKYFKKEIFSRDIYNILVAIDELVKSSDPDKTYEKYVKLFSQYESKQNILTTNSHDYF